MTKKDVKSHLLDHSEAKVRLLSEYIQRYLNIIGNDGFTRKIHVYDLFCGPGLYENGGHGSPIVIMSAVKELYENCDRRGRKAPQIDCHFNDIDPEKVNNAQAAIFQEELNNPRFGKITFSTEDYKELLKFLPEKFENLKNEKAFVFIDPYEYKHIKINHIRALMNSGNSEVLLWLPTQFMYRFEKNGTPTALKDFIEEIVPFKEWNKSTSGWTFVSQLVDGFQKAIGNKYFVDSFTIEKDKNTVFCLFFFTSHIKGFEKMLESKWKIDKEEGKGWSYTGDQMNLFSEQKTNPLAEKLEHFLSQGPKTNSELFEITLRARYLTKHCTEVLTNWQESGKISVQLPNGEKARKRAFYINYKDYKNDPGKVIIKLN